MNRACLQKQHGTTMLLTLVFVVGLFGIIGLAIDSGNVLLNKTRLQNALDAAALSAASTVNADPKKDTAKATTAGIATFDLFKKTPGNSALSKISLNVSDFQYSKYLTPFGPGTTPPAFVRVSTRASRGSATLFPVPPILLQVLGLGTQNVSAESTAGAVGQNCKLAPLVICQKSGVPSGCDATSCNGVPFHKKVCLKGGTDAKKQATCQDASLPNGNFGLLRFDGMSGGADIRTLLSGAVDTCKNTATWENGNKVGPVSQGLDDRFAADLVQTEYKPPKYLNPFPTGGYYPQYVADTNAKLAIEPRPTGIAYMRTMAVPVVESCDVTPLKIVAAACFLVTEKATHKGTVNEIVGELTGSCPGPGPTDPTKSVLYGPYKIVIFHTEGSNDS
jgi:Flp pilus assembly protein TadG